MGKGDVIDYTYLQKRGFIKKNEEVKKDREIRTKDGFVDLSGMNFNKSNSASDEKRNEEMVPNPFSGFESLAASTPAQMQPQPQTNNTESSFLNFIDNPSLNSTQTSFDNLNNNSQLDEKDISAIKIKIEDLEYKLVNLVDKLELIESKLDNFQKRVLN